MKGLTFEEAAREAGCVTLAIPRRIGDRVEWVPAAQRMGDWAVTPADRGHMDRRYPARKWVITHVHTGLKVPGKPVVLKRALGALEALRHVKAETPEQLAEAADTVRSVCLRHFGYVSETNHRPDHAEHFIET